MNWDDARQLLQLQPGAPHEEIVRAYIDQKAMLQERHAQAPTDVLKRKCLAQLQQLRLARDLLLALNNAGPNATPSNDAEFQTVGFTGHGEKADQLLLREGALLGGRYEIRRPLGAGGMGAVYAAYDRNRGKEIALKAMLPALLAKPQARERFLSEARLSCELAHPGIVRVYDVQHEGDQYFILMELLEGRTLREEMVNRASRGRAFSAEDALEIMLPVCDALHYAHTHTIHRDIKPENIFLSHFAQVKLLDFGIARGLRTGDAAAYDANLGTAYYMAPEQRKGNRDIDPRADQYSVAVVLYEMLTGELPVGRVKSVKSLRDDVPKKLSDAIDRALEAKANERYADMAAFAAALRGKPKRTGAPKLRAALVALAVMLALACTLALASARGRSELSWVRAAALNTEQAYQNFLIQYPDSRHRARAGELLGSLSSSVESPAGAQTKPEPAQISRARSPEAATRVNELQLRLASVRYKEEQPLEKVDREILLAQEAQRKREEDARLARIAQEEAAEKERIRLAKVEEQKDKERQAKQKEKDNKELQEKIRKANEAKQKEEPIEFKVAKGSQEAPKSNVPVAVPRPEKVAEPEPPTRLFLEIPPLRLGSVKVGTEFTHNMSKGPPDLHYRWSVNGQVVGEGVGKRSVTFTCPKTPGSLNVSVTLSKNGQRVAHSSGTLSVVP